jgi:hypothetical protein
LKLFICLIFFSKKQNTIKIKKVVNSKMKYTYRYNYLVIFLFVVNSTQGETTPEEAVNDTLDRMESNFAGSISSLTLLVQELGTNLNQLQNPEIVSYPEWIIRAQATSDSVPIILSDGIYYVCLNPADCQPYIALKEGDHNLWYDEKNNLWGYDQYGSLFKATADGSRISSEKGIIGCCIQASQTCKSSCQKFNISKQGQSCGCCA